MSSMPLILLMICFAIAGFLIIDIHEHAPVTADCICLAVIAGFGYLFLAAAMEERA